MAKGKGKISVAGLAESLVRYGIDPGLSDIVAAGVLSELQGWCWAGLTDLVGTADVVDEICHNILPPGSLAKLLVKHGLLNTKKGVFFLPSAYTERSVYVDKRWRREHPDMLKAAKQRAGTRKGDRDRQVVVPLSEPDIDPAEEPKKEPGQAGRPFKDDRPEPTENLIIGTNLFGEPVIDEKAAALQRKKERRNERGNKKGIPGYAELTTYWFDEWGATEGRGVAKYPFKSVDGKAIKEILDTATDFEHACAIIDAYIQCKDRWYRGKPLRKLTGDIARFVAETTDGHHQAGEVPYRDGIEGLAVFTPGAGADGEGARDAEADRTRE